MWKALFVAAFVALPSPVAAQHPCDIANPTVYREPASKLARMKVGFCFEREDTTGAPIVEAVGFAIQINHGPNIDLGILQPLTEPNAKGEQYYETYATLAPGVLTVTAYTVNGMSAPSAPITLTVNGGPKNPTTVILKPPTR